MTDPAVERRRGGAPLRRRMGPRDRDETHRAATPLELLFDLCFVVTVAQAADHLHHALLQGRTAGAVISYVTIFFTIWWAWMNFTWFASAYDTDDVAYRLLTLLQIGGVLLTAGVAAGFDRQDFTMHQSWCGGGVHSELMFDSWIPTVKDTACCCGQPGDKPQIPTTHVPADRPRELDRTTGVNVAGGGR